MRKIQEESVELCWLFIVSFSECLKKKPTQNLKYVDSDSESEFSG